MNGKMYRGALMVDPACPGMRYTFRTRVQIQRHQPCLLPEKHCYEMQGDEVYQWKCDRERKEDPLYTKFRTCTKTHESVVQKLAEMGLVIGESSAAASGSATSAPPSTTCKEEGHHAAFADEQDSEDEPHEDDLVAAGSSAGPVLNAEVVTSIGNHMVLFFCQQQRWSCQLRWFSFCQERIWISCWKPLCEAAWRRGYARGLLEYTSPHLHKIQIVIFALGLSTRKLNSESNYYDPHKLC